MNKVLITGGTGFLCSHIISRIIDKVDSITVATTDIRQNTTLKKLGVDLNKINLVKGDVRDFDFLRLLFNELCDKPKPIPNAYFPLLLKGISFIKP